ALDFAEVEKREIEEAAAIGAEDGLHLATLSEATMSEATSDSTGIKETTIRLDDAATIIAREKAVRKRNAKQAKIIAKSSEADDAIGRVIRMMRPEWPFLAAGAFAAAVSGCVRFFFASQTFRSFLFIVFLFCCLRRAGCYGCVLRCSLQVFPIFSYVLGNVVGVLLQDKSKIDPGPFQGANLYAFGFGKIAARFLKALIALPREGVFTPCVATAVIVGIIAFLSYSMNIYFFQLAAAKFVKRLRAQMFSALMNQEVGYFDHEDNALGAVTSRLATDATAVAELVTNVWGDIVQLIVTVICGLGIAFATAWNLTLIIIVVVPFLATATWYESRLHKGVESSSKKAYEKSGEVAAEAFKEIRTVAALTRESYFQDKYVAAIYNPHRLALRKAYLSSLGHGANSGFQMFATAVGFYAGFRLIIGGHMDAADLYTCIMAVTVTAQTVGRASLFPSYVAKGKIAAVKTFSLLFRKSRIDPGRDGEKPLHIDGNFEFKNVAFAYPSRPDQMIFEGKFNLSGKANQTIALVGPSGCGKSTTIGMLERFYDSISGVVSVDSKDVKSYQLIEGLRHHIALVGQVRSLPIFPPPLLPPDPLSHSYHPRQSTYLFSSLRLLFSPFFVFAYLFKNRKKKLHNTKKGTNVV
ncbi:MAG: LOW QUALITY PROTEIN: ABC transporter type 1, transmembrane domain-containing protein, partial [Olpidium bornovanus]